MSETPSPALVGPYWTDRHTQGELRFERASTTCADDLEGARGLVNRAAQKIKDSSGRPPRQRIAPE